MSRRKSGIGKQQGDSFSGDIVPRQKRLNDYRQSNRVSFYLPKDDSADPIDQCGINPIEEPGDLDIIDRPGRKLGFTPEYGPVQQLNYLSQYSRYEKGIELAIAGKLTRDGKDVYLFCSKQSPTGYWEVTVGGAGTFINFTPPLLTIICPRPFRLNELVQAETDGDELIWTQLTGRTTIVSTDEDSLNPVIAILGQRSSFDLPIQLLAELPGNESVFEILVIRTTCSDAWLGVGGAEELDTADPDYQVRRLVILLSRENFAFRWQLNQELPVMIAPPIATKWLISTQLQANNNGVYENVLPQVRIGKHYRVISQFNILEKGVTYTQSPRFFFDPNPSTVFQPVWLFALDKWAGMSGCDGEIVNIQYEFLSLTLHLIDIWQGNGGSDGELIDIQYDLTTQTLAAEDEWQGNGGIDGEIVTIGYQLGSVIVG